MRLDDWRAFYNFDQDSEVARLCDEPHFPRSPEKTEDWVRQALQANPAVDVFRWVIENLEGQVVGTLNTFDCNRRCGTFKYGLAIGRNFWRRGYASESIRLVLAYYFRELRYQKVTVHIYDFATASLALHERLGFQPEGRLRRIGFTNGKYFDELILGMTIEEFEAKSGASSN